VCKGFDHAAITKAAIAKGWMRKGTGKHLTLRERVPGGGNLRLYCVTSAFLEGEKDEAEP
jgi:hypothetical protein